MIKILERIVKGQGQRGDIELLLDITKQIDGRSFCGLGDAAAWPVAAALQRFREEFEYYIEHGKSMVDSSRELVLLPM